METQQSEFNPLVSIITVVYNGEKYLEDTIKSVMNQTYQNIEYIVIDGGSTDGTIDIIKKYEDKINYWVSEKDKGIYDALNKGLKVASGEYIAILNADDYFVEDFIESSLALIIGSQTDYCISNVKFINKDSIIKPIYPLVENYIYQEMPYPHVGALISKKAYDNVGLFDTRFKIAGDHDMALRIHLAGYKCSYLNKVTAQLEEGGVSSSSMSNKESKLVAIKNGKNKYKAYMTYLYQLLKVKIYHLLPINIVRLIQGIKKSRFV